MELANCRKKMKVRWINKEWHNSSPKHYPPVGTIGVIKKVSYSDIYVQWPKGSTSGDDAWYCRAEDVEEVEECEEVKNNSKSTDMTDHEIWDMLSAKMQKNGVKVDCFKTVSNIDFPNLRAFNYPLYSKETLIKAVALAYRVGYARAVKGRPFKYGDKVEKTEKSGHWKRIDPNNLPPIGAKLRLVEANPEGSDFFTEQDIGKIYYRVAKGVIAYNPYKELWVKKEDGGFPLCSSEMPEQFDYWVED